MISSALAIFRENQSSNRKEAHTTNSVNSAGQKHMHAHGLRLLLPPGKYRNIIAFPNVKEHIFNYYETNNLLTLLSLDYGNKEQGRNSKLSTLMVYGDSIGLHYYRLATNRPLCKELFRTCSKKYMWTYDVSWKI